MWVRARHGTSPSDGGRTAEKLECGRMKGNDPSALQQISNHTPTCISAAPAALDR